MPPPFEVLHSASWWKDYHTNRARRRTRALANFAPDHTDGLDLEPQQPVITFVPGRSAPIYSRVGPNGSLVPLPSDSDSFASGPSTTTPAPLIIPTTATHSLPPSRVIARYKRERNIPDRDPDAELLARLQQSRANAVHRREHSRARAVREREENTALVRARDAREREEIALRVRCALRDQELKYGRGTRKTVYYPRYARAGRANGSASTTDSSPGAVHRRSSKSASSLAITGPAASTPKPALNPRAMGIAPRRA
ncbi:hypothetical protein B0H11DRAFT_2239001 [Mycena galericulata]|nr:hypothetical protein B0H11DRAFT_2239001 [Mycena galericulata]